MLEESPTCEVDTLILDFHANIKLELLRPQQSDQIEFTDALGQVFPIRIEFPCMKRRMLAQVRYETAQRRQPR
jgi:hypothetical protein